MADTRALVDAVYASPADDGPRAVYADALLEAGNPLGEFIQLQLARARGKSGTKAKEQRLFDPSWWKDHPLSRIGGELRYDGTHRGFPTVFSPALHVGEERQKQINGWQALVGHPAWSTLRLMSPHVDDPVIARILLGTPMPLLEEVNGVGPRTLAALAKRQGTGLAATRLWAKMHDLSDEKPLLSLDCFPRLRSLAWFVWSPSQQPKPPLPDALAQLGPLRVLERIEALELGGYGFSSLVHESLGLMAQLPAGVRSLQIHGAGFLEEATVERTETAELALSLGLTARSVPPAATALAAVARARLSSLRIRFVKGGYFTKRELPGLLETLRQATRHLADCELPSKIG